MSVCEVVDPSGADTFDDEDELELTGDSDSPVDVGSLESESEVSRGDEELEASELSEVTAEWSGPVDVHDKAVMLPGPRVVFRRWGGAVRWGRDDWGDVAVVCYGVSVG